MVKDNVNILWLNPLLFFIAIMQWVKALRFVTFILAVIVALCTIIALILYLFGISYFNIAYIPLALLLLIRIGNYIRRRLKKGVKIGSRELKIRL
jgi:ABC-type bacteriocin/lantibiotic exporter with double-glycine peptidase domain